MTAKRTYRRFAYKDANFRICTERFDAATDEIRRQREALEAYITRHAAFGESLEPIDCLADAPPVAHRMAAAASLVGVGPMAAVAGTMAQLAAEAAIAAGSAKAIVENGGDLYAICTAPLLIGLYAGDSPLADRLALRIDAADTPVAVCSSSGRMGHSLSLGDCDLATVVAPNASLADAAATYAANLVRTPADIDPVCRRIAALPGIRGVLIVKADRIGLAGHPGELVPNRDTELELKVTRDPDSR